MTHSSADSLGESHVEAVDGGTTVDEPSFSESARNDTLNVDSLPHVLTGLLRLPKLPKTTYNKDT